MGETQVTLSATLSAIASDIFSSSYWNYFLRPLIQYLVSPAVFASVVALILLKALDLGSLRERFSQFCGKVESLENDVKSLLKSTTRVETFLATQHAGFEKLLSGQSPVQLLSKGMNLLNKSGFKKTYEENKEFFLNEIKKGKPESPADVDRIATEIMLNLIDNKMLIGVKANCFRKQNFNICNGQNMFCLFKRQGYKRVESIFCLISS